MRYLLKARIRPVRFEGETLLDLLRRTSDSLGDVNLSGGKPTRWLGWRGVVVPEQARRNHASDVR